MASTGGRTLFIPSVRKGNGYGHLRRCLNLARRMGEGSRVWPYPGTDDDYWSLDELTSRFPENEDLWIDAPSPGWDLVVVDRRESGIGEGRLFHSFGPVVFLDEGGASREAAVALLDTLPYPGSPANRASTGFLDLPRHRRGAWPPEVRRVLVAFGGEDARAQGVDIAQRLRHRDPEWDITLVKGPLNGTAAPVGVAVLDAPSDLAEQLADYDLLVGGFGLTCFEALHARVPVVVVPQSPYHATLAKKAGIPVVGEDLAGFPSLSDARRAAEDAVPEGDRDLAGELATLKPQVPGCPVCGDLGPAEYREPDRSFFTCDTCGITYQKRLVPQALDYGPEYFFEQYRDQYGKTYLDDFAHLRRLASDRLRILESLIEDKMQVLDVGCAYGAFLAEAAARGHSVHGLDVSEAAIDYVRRDLGLVGFCGPFPEGLPDDGPPSYSALTMWYVIEHFPEVGEVLRAAADLLDSGGVLAFSTPNLGGISGRSNRQAFFRSNPEDHYTLWSTTTVGRVLAREGFRVERVRITGHHPERFPAAGGDPGPLQRFLFGTMSRVRGLGDTFEVYARKE